MGAAELTTGERMVGGTMELPPERPDTEEEEAVAITDLLLERLEEVLRARHAEEEQVGEAREERKGFATADFLIIVQVSA